jgi:hypothetical protein
MNFNTLDWIDENENDVFDEGDSIDNHTLVAGATTMMEWIFVYE